jgi:tetratricopeptide (TPR) repeat protein
VSKGISKKELRQPDEFVSFWTHTAQKGAKFVEERRQALIIGVTMLGTVVVGSIVFSVVSEGRAARATEALARIERIATAELRPDDAAKPGADGAPTPPPATDDGVPHFKTAKERDEATLKELDAFLAGPRNSLTQSARLERGPLLLALGRAPEALTTYEAILADKPDDRLRFLAREGLGYAQEQKGDLEAAAGTFAKLADDAAVFKEGGGFYKDRAVYHKARIAELRGNADDARKLYREVLDKSPTTSLRDEITNRLAVLELK